MHKGQQNPAFVSDDGVGIELGRVGNGHVFPGENAQTVAYTNGLDQNIKATSTATEEKPTTTTTSESTRQTWGGSLEFLMSCIAMSVGLGNIWRFPFTAYENGGGAFLVPYVIVLFLIGKPIYYLEMIVGQFTNRSSVKLWSVAPGLRGVGWAQMFSMIAVGTYYCSLMSLTIYYLVSSFRAQLPWAVCDQAWPDCVDSKKAEDADRPIIADHRNITGLKSSAELYFKRTVLMEVDSIDEGLGPPNWRLVICLLFAWLCILGVLAKGVHTSGKAAYFLALFPYVVMFALLIRAVTLEGAWDGILFFIKPDWTKLFEADVWYAAVTQCFFSLSVCFGGLITYASYNDFRHNIYKDVIIVTTLDTLTSLLAGFTIFGILGNLAHEMGTTEVGNIVQGGSGLAFISYPDAIAKFSILPQFFSFLFFLMLYVLGIGSGIALTGGIISIINDEFPHWKHWYIVLATTTIGFAVGCVYCTQGGQFVLGLVDYYAASFVVFILASLEVTGIFWLYGLEAFLDDTEFMLKQRPSAYWRLCWAVVTPLMLITIFVYTVANLTPLTYEHKNYPPSAHAAGWTLLAFGVLQIPFWFAYALVSNRQYGLTKMFAKALRPSSEWGPLRQADRQDWMDFKERKDLIRAKRTSSRLKQFVFVLFACEDKLD